MSTLPIAAAAARALTEETPMTTLADALANDLHQATENARNQLHRDIEAVIGRYLTVPNLARELADTLAQAPTAPPAPPAPAAEAGP